MPLQPAQQDMGITSACPITPLHGTEDSHPGDRNSKVITAAKADVDAVDTLITVRDWLRYAVSCFNDAQLVYGHGTSTALDEAAFLILSSLHLPIDQLEPWLDARLTRPERTRLSGIVHARIDTRKPAPYLTNCAYIRGHRFYVDERVIVPRSFIGELLDEGLESGLDGGIDAIIADADGVAHILDLCTGGGSLAILAALKFPNAHVDAVDLSADSLAVATRNIADYGLAERITLLRSDLFAALTDRRYDLILSNPPYVTDAAVAAFPPEYQAEPVLAHAGGIDGMDLVHRILAQAADHMTADGQLVVEIGLGRDVLETAHPGLPFLWLDSENSQAEVFALPASALAPKPSRRKPKR